MKTLFWQFRITLYSTVQCEIQFKTSYGNETESTRVYTAVHVYYTVQYSTKYSVQVQYYTASYTVHVQHCPCGRSCVIPLSYSRIHACPLLPVLY